MLRFLCIFMLLLMPSIASAYWNESWGFRTEFILTESSGTDLVDYQYLLTLTAADLHADYVWSSDGRDLRIIDSDDSTEMHYWIDSWDATTQTAEIWIYFAQIDASSNRSFYIYYGNENASSAAAAMPVFTYEGIKFHTRNVTTDPNNKGQAFAQFEAATDDVDGYGCTFITDFTNISNTNTFPNGQNNNFIAYSESYFEVKAGEEGTWGVRYGADFGRGGALYVNDQVLEQRWNRDLWWNYNWNATQQTLEGTITLTEGYHKLEVIGAEDCCDGGITVQFQRPGGQWETFSTANIDIRSYSCPMPEPTLSYGGHETRTLDLSLTASEPDLWVVGSGRELIFYVANNGPDDAAAGTEIAVTLASPLSVTSVTGSGWSCSGSTGTLSCSYSTTIAAGNSAVALTLWTQADNASVTSASYAATVSGTQYDIDSSNNSVSSTVNIRSLILPSGTDCTSPGSGLWARYFDTTTSSVDFPANATEFQTMVDTFSNETYLDGQTLRDNVNGSGDPFDDRADEYYLTLMQGYLYIPGDGDWGIALDGDDAVELLLNDVVRTAWYNGHGESGSATNGVTLGLARGYHKFEFRHQEYTGGDAYYAYWRQGTSGTYSIIPASNFVQCGGVFDLQLTPSAEVLSDPINGNSAPKAIPSAIVQYTVLAENMGTLNSDTDTTEIIQALDVTGDLYVGDGSVSPVSFSDGSGSQSSGVAYSFPAGLSYSCDDGATFTCTPTVDADGYSADVTHFRLMLDGSLMPQLGTLQPQFTYQYQIRLQ